MTNMAASSSILDTGGYFDIQTTNKSSNIYRVYITYTIYVLPIFIFYIILYVFSFLVQVFPFFALISWLNWCFVCRVLSKWSGWRARPTSSAPSAHIREGKVGLINILTGRWGMVDGRPMYKNYSQSTLQNDKTKSWSAIGVTVECVVMLYESVVWFVPGMMIPPGILRTSKREGRWKLILFTINFPSNNIKGFIKGKCNIGWILYILVNVVNKPSDEKYNYTCVSRPHIQHKTNHYKRRKSLREILNPTFLRLNKKESNGKLFMNKECLWDWRVTWTFSIEYDSLTMLPPGGEKELFVPIKPAGRRHSHIRQSRCDRLLVWKQKRWELLYFIWYQKLNIKFNSLPTNAMSWHLRNWSSSEQETTINPLE